MIKGDNMDNSVFNTYALKQIDEDKKQSEYMKVIEELFDLG